MSFRYSKGPGETIAGQSVSRFLGIKVVIFIRQAPRYARPVVALTRTAFMQQSFIVS